MTSLNVSNAIHSSRHGAGGADEITPADIGADVAGAAATAQSNAAADATDKVAAVTVTSLGAITPDGVDTKISDERVSERALQNYTYALDAKTGAPFGQGVLGTNPVKVGPIVSKNFSGGTFDANMTESPAVWWDTNLNRWGMVYTGYTDNAGNPGAASVGLAFSDDLFVWTPGNGTAAILSGSGVVGDPDRYGCTAPVIVMEDGVYYLFYAGLGSAGYEGPPATMCVATATSITGPWTRQGAIISPSGTGWRSAMIYHPSIVKRGSTYYVFFNAKGSDVKEKIGYATATSLLGPWTVDDVNSPVLSQSVSGWDGGTIVGDPSVYRQGDYWVMSYYGYDGTYLCDGLAFTTDALFPLGWTKYAGNPVLQPSGTGGAIVGDYSRDGAAKPFIVFANGRQFHFFSYTGQMGAGIGLAVEGGGATGRIHTKQTWTGAGFTISQINPTWGQGQFTDIIIDAKVGDWVEAGCSLVLANQAVDLWVDFASCPAASPVNWWSGGSASGRGIAGMYRSGGSYTGTHGSIAKQIVASDLNAKGGLRIRAQMSVSSLSRDVLGSPNLPQFWVRNLSR